jgi:hypothetical protein
MFDTPMKELGLTVEHTEGVQQVSNQPLNIVPMRARAHAS